MYCIINKEQIIEGLHKATNIIPAKTGAAYFKSLWLKAENSSLTLMISDSNIEFTGSYEVEVKEQGLVGVNGKSFVELLRRLPNGEVHIKLDESNNLVINQGRRNYKLPVNDNTWFQELNSFPEENAILWAGDLFKELIDKVLFCISDDETQDAISCLFIKACGEGKLDVCGLNGHQFAKANFVNQEFHDKLPENGLLIQKKYVQDLRKWLENDEIEINITEKRVFMRRNGGNEMLSIPRAHHTYPDYNTFLDRLNVDSSELKLNRKEALEAYDRIFIFNTENDRCTYFNLSSSEAVLSVQDQQTGSATESLEIKYNGDIGKIAFPTKNMMEIFNRFESEELMMTLTTNEGPCGITADNDKDYMVLIMPMKINEEMNYEEVE